MEKERKIRILSIGALLVAIIGLTVAFAAMSRTLIINGTATVDSAKWDIHFENPLLKSKKGDAREVEAPVISNEGGDLTLKVGLRKPQDEIVYNVDVVNAGDIDAEITKIDYPELSEEHAKIIEFEAVYDDGSSIALAQELKAGDILEITGVIYNSAPIIFLTVSPVGGTVLASVYAVYNYVLVVAKSILRGVIDAPRFSIGQLIKLQKQEDVWKVFFINYNLTFYILCRFFAVNMV